ncbi:protein-L-isoaspartate(D-aspartate) O-methyltransferase [Halovenus rubra]|uniref:Protein-L-isoaspartate O-methyltransferase n=2 Tax=Halovenus rubra TaxID=869890 RepID=A0ABD5X7A9_9EURY|nr:protein-L-isoaspartate(D-aspartate) O-methyltransferase [Halovenus rubra]
MTFDEERNALIDRLADRENLSESTEMALRSVPRHEFVPELKQAAAYSDKPLPIGEGQTISAPHMVAIMTDLLDLSPGDTVLEIGTGCGYHVAVTATIVGGEHTYSIEYHERLAKQARKTLNHCGHSAISLRHGDGRDGWPEHGPYDRIYLTCAASSFPDCLIEQLRDGGLILGPLGDRTQVLTTAHKSGTKLERERHGQVRFVPFK